MNRKNWIRKIPSILLILFIIFTGPFYVWGATYYVNATKGNDQNDGISPATAWKTISKVNRSTFNPGDIILFKRGEIWRENLIVPSSGTSGNPITFGAYENGDNPLISGPGMDHCITISNKHYVTIDSIDCKYADDEGIDITSSTYFIIKNLSVAYCYSDGINVHGASTSGGLVDNCMTYNNGHSSGPDMLTEGSGIILYDGATGNTVQNCKSYGNKEDGIALGGLLGSFCGINNIIQSNECYNNGESGIDIKKGPNIIRKNILRDNFGINDGEGHGIVLGWDADQIEITENEIYSNRFRGISIWGSGGKHLIRYNKIYNNTFEGIYSEGGNSSRIEYNLIFNNGQYGIFLSNSPSNSYCTNNCRPDRYHIYNNTVWENKDYQLISVAPETIVKNNILGGSKSGNLAIAFIGSGMNHPISDYNDLFGVDNFCRWGDRYINFTDYRSLSSQDRNSISQDPMFTDVPNSNFNLRSNSPCIDSGTDVGLSQDIDGKAVPQGEKTDIGAFEYIPQTISPPKNLRILRFQ